MDESGFSLNYPLSKCWMKVHEQKALPANTQVRSGCLLAGVLDWQSAEVWAQPIQKLSSDSPDMNLIERFWKHLKQRVTANRLFAHIQALMDAIQAELTLQNNPDYPFRFSFSTY